MYTKSPSSDHVTGIIYRRIRVLHSYPKWLRSPCEKERSEKNALFLFICFGSHIQNDKFKGCCKIRICSSPILSGYRLSLIFWIISAYSSSLRYLRPGFMAKGVPHSNSSDLYLGTRWKCRWQPPSP